ncbi:adenine-specific methyltransferase EcoRI family protein [Moraxella macacae]|uniref:adenine-specific methyltransferase EcoRI family protein n=1 Tax=Moraxella macacae TaxID=765840 RepID=UPI0003187503|nr:adenine-specific methyltransferase EcoRI family protein [Moraxella macacae]
MNAITYKDLFPLIQDNKVWLGATNFNQGMYFRVPEGFIYAESYKFEREQDGVKVNRVPGVCWFTNIEHGRRHQPLQLLTMEENLRFNKKIQGKNAYQQYDNYNAIEVPVTSAIPSDYDGVMGVPISFLDKYCPEQFEILGMCENEDLYNLKTKVYSSQEKNDAYFAKFGKKGNYDLNASAVLETNNRLEKVYQRILIRHIKKELNNEN